MPPQARMRYAIDWLRTMIARQPKVPGVFLYGEHMLSELFRGILEYANRMEETRLAPYIKAFLETYTLLPYPSHDRLPHNNEKHGSTILPGYHHKPELRPGKEHWDAFMKLYRELEPCITACKPMIEELCPNETQRAKAVLAAQTSTATSAPYSSRRQLFRDYASVGEHSSRGVASYHQSLYSFRSSCIGWKMGLLDG